MLVFMKNNWLGGANFLGSVVGRVMASKMCTVKSSEPVTMLSSVDNAVALSQFCLGY